MARTVWGHAQERPEGMAVTTSPYASDQVGAAAAAGALAGAHINSVLATADTDAALYAAQDDTPAS